MIVKDFTSDNAGQPDKYTLQSNCNRIRVIEKDLTVATLARARIYLPVGASTYIELQPGEMSPPLHGNPAVWVPGYQPFSMETVNVASTVFSVIEDLEI